MTNYEYEYSIAEYDEKRRQDAALKARIQEIIEAKLAAVVEAEELLQRASKILTDVPMYKIDDPIYVGLVGRVVTAEFHLERGKKYLSLSTETYLENKAASRYGEVVQNDMNK